MVSRLLSRGNTRRVVRSRAGVGSICSLALGSARAGDEAVLVGPDDCVDAVAQTQFGEDVGHVGFDGFGADEHLGRDLSVAEAACQVQQGVVFAFRQYSG